MHYFPIAHYTSCLPLFPLFLQDITSHLKKIEDNVYEKYLGVNKVCY